MTFKNNKKNKINKLDTSNIGPVAKKMKFNDITETFILTDQISESVKLLQWCIEQGVCVLLNGPVGSGKTVLVEYLAKKMQKSLFKLQISDDTDARTLLGGYCCTEIPGRFEWRQGPLLSAMSRGSWLLLEDVACGQPNLLGLLRPLLEASFLGVRPSIADPMQPESNIIAHRDFRIIVTQSLMSVVNGYAEPRIMCSSYGANCLSKCQPIMLHSLTTESLQQIISANFPKLVNMLPKLIGDQSLVQFVMFKSSAESKQQQSRINSARDLFNFCRRLTNFDDNNNSEDLPATLYFLDSLDCFIQHMPDIEQKKDIIDYIGSVFNLNKTNVESILNHRLCKIFGDSVNDNIINIGRVKLVRNTKGVKDCLNPSKYFAQTRQMMHLLESLARSVQMHEPVLLVSETGCGKTSTVQYLSKLVNRKLTVLNMNQQSDSSDLLGGFKPVNNSFSEKEICNLSLEIAELVDNFNNIFKATFSSEQNNVFLVHVQNTHETKDFEKLLNLIGSELISKAVFSIRTLSESLKKKWTDFYTSVEELKTKMIKLKCNMTFMFIEGALVKAVKNGDWVLLDEINLAPPEMLQSLSGLLESAEGSLTLVERGDESPVYRHPDFRLFACMNPATDVGKRNLPQGLRNRFTEIYLQELTDLEELSIIVKHYIGSLSPKKVECIVKFYLALRNDVKTNQIIDGGGNRPQFSLRTLCRALEEIRNFINNELYRTTMDRSIFEGLSFSFKSQLSDDSRTIFDKKFETFFGCKLKTLESTNIISKNVTQEILSQKGYKLISGFPIKLGPNYSMNIEENDEFLKTYKITKSVQKNLRDLSRIISGGKTLPVLVQGETSVGKTSLIIYLAKLTGNVYHRINNHESTDIQEYLGCYVNENDKLVFKEGLLATAMRKGHWIILDELNLAPTDILEALNRVLDDNRQLFIAETQTTITAHPMFRIFATQNPPGLYGGRKVLSRALRNRFIELHFNPIPNEELVEILEECCKIPRSRSIKMVETMRLLQSDSQELDVVHCKRSYISLRDLFRWARRVYREHSKSSVTFDWDRQMVEEGYLLLTGKARSEQEVGVVSKILAKIFKNVNVQLNDEWFFSKEGSNIAQSVLSRCEKVENIGNIEWTHDFRRMVVLLIRAIECDEPTLLVGNTGCGKTTICHLAAALNHQEMLSINCHMHTEASDFLGGLRPNTKQDENQLFQWVDGPLVIAMKEGKMFLIDEISLADDSVLERLNSVLESDRKLTLVENGEVNLVDNDDINQSIEIRASKGFQVFATMNPGGDFGKKELSPALKNRFTEIWCPSNSWSTTNRGLNDWVNIASRNLHSLSEIDIRQGTANILVHFLRAVNEIGNEIKFSVLSIRDLLSWVDFINLSIRNSLSLFESIVHGAYMVVIDSISDKIDKETAERRLIGMLLEKVDYFLSGIRKDFLMEKEKYELETVDNRIGIHPFYIEMGPDKTFGNEMNYSFGSKTTGSNLWRLLRALQISKKPLLLEGSPGVGKTSLVSQLAKIAGFKVVRINLSEQTDANDLFGCFLPIENGVAGQLCWRDGPLLQALKNGHWILLDEMNLASQSVLESLNACLDHRGEIFIPELNRTFSVKPGQTRLFACQNPMSEGGGRKGLPKSFVNRFTQVYMSALLPEDYREILSCLYHNIPETIISFMVLYVQSLKENVVILRKFGVKGSPWEFNLRDLCRWCDLMITHQSGIYEPSFFVTLLFIDRFRLEADKEKARELYNELAGKHGQLPLFVSELKLHITHDTIRLGQAKLQVKPKNENNGNDTASLQRSLFLNGQLAILESMMLTVSMGWMTILVGPSGAGKTSLVNILANITGNKLQTMSMNSSMDTTDLLGSFEQQKDGGKFKWMDSMLVQALKTGDWLVLDTVNFCNASVLDRLNGLLEPNGTLLLTERGLLDGNQLEEVRPHKDFRIFLVLDPDCGGEISKAMRNRGLEISSKLIEEKDVLSILTKVYRLAVKDGHDILRFHNLLNDARGTLPQIRPGSVTSIFQTGGLLSKDHTLKESLKSVYGETQLFFNVREDVKRFIEELTEDETEVESFSSSLLLENVMTNPVQSFVKRDFEVLSQIMKEFQPLSNEDYRTLAKLFMISSSKKDLLLRLETTDGSLHEECQRIADILIQCPTKDESTPIDVRHLPNWIEFKEQEFFQENRTLFAIYNIGNIFSSDVCQKIKALKPSQLNKDSINHYNVEEISKLFSTGKLSRNLCSRFSGLDKNTDNFITLIKSIDFEGMCTIDNLYNLRKVCKMVNRFCCTVPAEGNRWLSTYVYHVTAIMEHMGFCGSIKNICMEIFNHLNKLDLCQDAEIVDKDDLKFSKIKRKLMRVDYPHSELIDTEEKYEVLVEAVEKRNKLSVWNAYNAEKLKDVLYETFALINGTSSTVEDLANNSNTESVKIWPFLMNILITVLNSMGYDEGVSQLQLFFKDLSNSQFKMLSLPYDFGKSLETIGSSSRYIMITDWVKYLIGQSRLNTTLSSCRFVMDKETEEYELKFEFPQGFLKPDIANIWSCPDNSVFLLISGIENRTDAITYFNNLKHTDLAKRTLRSVKERKLQLEFCKETLLECSALLSTNRIRIINEIETMEEMLELQRKCLLSCNSGLDEENRWLSEVAPWFMSLENDFITMKNNQDQINNLTDIGKLWIRWGVIQMKLFAIMEPLDPQTQIYWENLYLKEELDLVSSEEKLSKAYRERMNGVLQEGIAKHAWSIYGVQHPILHATSKRIVELQEKLSKLSANIGLRPVGDDKYSELRLKTLRFISKYGWNVLCDGSMTTVKDIGSGFIIEWSMAASELLNYMLEESGCIAFPDLVEPFALGVSRTLSGMSMLMSDEMANLGNEKQRSVRRITDLFCQFPNINSLDLVTDVLNKENEIMEDIENLIGKCDSKTKGRIHIKLLHLCLRLLLFYKNSDLKSKKDETKMFTLLHNILSTFETLWKKQEEKRLEKEEAAGKIYISKQTVTENLSEEEIEELEIYLNVCPKNSGIENMEMSAAMNCAASQIRQLREKLESLENGLLLSEDTVHSVVRIATEIMFSELHEPDMSVFRDCYRFAAALISSDSANMVMSKNGDLLSSHLAALTWEVDTTEKGDQLLLSERPYDIYQDPVLAEDLYSAGTVLENLKRNLSRILDIYPEHAALLAIKKKLNNILNLSLEYPLIIFINNVERLIFEIEQWEIVAARHVSLKEDICELNKVLVFWRRSELKMWSNTLTTASWKLDYEVSLEFFNLYHILMTELNTPHAGENFLSINAIIEPLIISMNSAKVGNYKAKLEVFNLLIASLKTAPTSNEIFKTKLMHILSNHYDYYKLYLECFEQQLESEYKKIGKELKDFIKTQKWGDAPPKTTGVSKCHKIVFKYLRQWNGVIHRQCKTMMTLNPTNSLKKVKLYNLEKLEMKTELIDLDFEFSQSRISKWSEEMFSYFQEMWETKENYQRENKELELKAVTESKDVENKEVAEKKWRSEVKNLQQRKRNCVTNFVKYLKELGLKIFGTRFPAETALMTHLPLGDVFCEASSAIKCIGLRVQLDLTDKSEEFAKFNDFKDRLINICDDWLSRLCTNSTRIRGKEIGINKVKISIDQLKESLGSDVVSPKESLEICASINHMNSKNRERLSQWKLFVSKITQVHPQKKFPSMVPDRRKPLLCGKIEDEESKNIIDSILTDLKNSEQKGGYLTTTKEVHSVNKQKSVISFITNLIRSIKGQFSVQQGSNISSMSQGLCDLNRWNIALVSDLESEMNKQCEESGLQGSRILIIMEKAKSLINNNLHKFKKVLMENSDNMSFLSMAEHLESFDALTDPEVINHLLIELKECLMHMTCSELNKMRNVINEGLLPLLEFQASLFDEFVKLMKNYHHVLASGLDALLTVTAALIKDGFCVPDDSAWTAQTEENTNKAEKFNNFEMAGMDEGTGTNDVSDQIESESQLEGTDKDKQNEQPEDQQDVPDEENGIEMSDDFQGKTHDPEVTENEQEEDNNDKLDELEDKMGDVGDAKETDLNKETWDDKEEETKEEDKNDDEREGGVSKDDTTEIVADNNENKEMKENSENKQNKNELKEESEEGNEDEEGDDNQKDNFEEVNDGGEEEDGPEEKPDPALNEPEKESEMEDVEENNPLDDFFDNEEKLNEDEASNDKPEQNGEVQEDNLENQDEENIDNVKPNEEKTEEEKQSEEMEQSINIAGGIDAMDNKEMSYDTELGEKDNEEGASGNGSSRNRSTNTPSNTGKMDEELANDEQNESQEEENNNQKDDACEKRTLGDMNKAFKRKADVLDPEENIDPKKQKVTNAFAHMDSEQGDDGADQVLDNATAEQQQHIPEVNNEEMDISEISKDEIMKEDNQFGDIHESSGQVKEKEKVEKEKIPEVVVMEEVESVKQSWAQYESKSDYLARQLCEQLRNVLEPTKSNKLGGAFRTGKRLDMKKVIPYIASGFRKDKIWVRRNKPSQREYQVLIGVDNSKSIKYNVTNDLFFQSLSTVLNGLTFLEVGQVGVCKFGSSTEVVLPLHQQFSSEIGENLVNIFDFSDKCSKFIPMLEKAIELFTESRHSLSSTASPDTSQLLLLLSDGDVSEDVTDPRFTTLIREANNRGIFIVVIVFDHADPLNSILNSKLFIGEGNEYVRYLDVFPIPNYTVLQDVTKLPTLLTDILSQWFELASSADKGPSR